MSAFEKLFDLTDQLNIVDKFSSEQLAEVTARVMQGYEEDDSSRKDWKTAAEEGFNLVNQMMQEKTYPWEGAANVKYPLITVAAMQFAARAYPSIIPGSRVVLTKTKVTNPNPKQQEQARNVADHLNWQLLEEIENWDPETDVLLHALPIVGTYFRKTFYNQATERVESNIVSPLKVVINLNARSVEKAPRVTHELELSKNEVIERERSGEFSTVSDKMMSTNDQDTEAFIEQHCWYDYDKDGYEEPYIVTVHVASRTVARVVARFKEINVTDGNKIKSIIPHDYWTKYTFIPNPEGFIYDLGFGHLIGPLNHSVNTAFNQLLDAGSLSNLQAGFIAKTARGVSGNMSFKPGEWKPIDTMGQPLKDAILPLPVRDPSSVLFQLLGLMNEMAMKISSVTDVMTGENPGQNVPATTSLAMIEQGLKVFTSIYKRIHRAIKVELGKIYLLNSLYTPDNKVFVMDGEAKQVNRTDYTTGNMTVVPVTDPNQSSQTQSLAKANALMQVLPLNPTKSGKLFTLIKYYEAIGMQPDEIQQLLPAQEVNAPQPPPPEVLKIQLETQKAKDDMEIRRMELEQNIYKLAAEIDVLRTQAIKNIADAESKEEGQQVQQYQLQVDALNQKYSAMADITKQHLDFLKLQAQQNTKDGTPQSGAPQQMPKPSIPNEGIPVPPSQGPPPSEQGPQPGALGALKDSVMEPEV